MSNLELMRMVLLFLLQFAICEVGFLVAFSKKEHFFLRVSVGVVMWVALAMLYVLALRLIPGQYNYVGRHVREFTYFIVVVILNAFLVAGCYEITYYGALFTAIGAYSIEHIASRFSYILKAAIYGNREVPAYVVYGVFDFLIPVLFSVAFYYLLIKKSIADKKMMYRDRKVLIISGVNLFICIALSIFEPNIGDGSLEDILVICSNYGCVILACLLCILLQAGYFRESELDEKNRTLAEMLKIQSAKQSLSKETIEIINRKCHDLRHQIRMLEEQTTEQRSDSLKSIREAIHIYDSIVKTGNSSVDLVLMEKKLFCEKYDIKFTYMVDGKQFDFMDEADIYVMLGNMLENAIESVQKEPNTEKRIITFLAQAREEMLYISMENYCSHKVVFENGYPATDKDDKAFHGFGIKSIVHIAERYGGNARFINENDSFIVEILMPTS